MGANQLADTKTAPVTSPVRAPKSAIIILKRSVHRQTQPVIVITEQADICDRPFRDAEAAERQAEHLQTIGSPVDQVAKQDGCYSFRPAGRHPAQAPRRELSADRPGHAHHRSPPPYASLICRVPCAIHSGVFHMVCQRTLQHNNAAQVT